MHSRGVIRVSIVVISLAAIAGGCSAADSSKAASGAFAAVAPAPSSGAGVPALGGAPDASAAPSAPPATGSCTGSIASHLFGGALCACDDVNVQGYLRTRAFSSATGAPDASSAAGGAAVGINHDYVVSAAGANAGFTDIGGSFAIAGTATGFDGFLRVEGDLRAAGTVNVIGYTLVSRDAWMGADFLNTGFAQVGRDLHIEGKDMLPALVGGARMSGPVTVAPPCPCDPAQILDVGALVAAARTKSDDAAIGLDPAAWSALVGDAQISLPAGSYYVDAIRGIGNLVIHAGGPIAIYVGGDVEPIGRFAVDLAPGAEIDLFVQGALHLTGYSSLGDPSRPYATRIYSATSGDIDLSGYETFVGNLYAPAARVTSKGFVDVSGSLFVRDFLVAGFASFAYDLAVGGAGGSCAPAPDAGTSCDAWSCPSGQVCVNGACGECEMDADCSEQLVCQDGLCKPLAAK